jgi:tetratricopeptide (TPR) repeat protein
LSQYRRRALWAFGGLFLAGLLPALGTSLWWLHHYRAAESALKAFRLDKARNHLERCLQVWPYGAETQFLAAQTARRLDELDEAEQRLTEYERRHGPGPAVSLERALLRAQRGEVDHVKASLYALVDKDDPRADLALEALARGHLLNSRSDLAMLALDKLLGRHPDHIPALLLRAGLFDELNKPKDAAHDYKHAVQLDPEAFDPRLRLADLLSSLGQVREAIYHYRWLRQVRPGDARVVVGLCRCLEDQQELAEARRLLDELLASQPDDVPALVERGRIDLHSGNPDAALPLLRRASQLAPHDRDAFWVLHVCLEMLGKEEEDRRCLAEVARIDGDRQRLSNLLGRIQEDPQDLSLRYEAGLLLLHTGREAEGVRLLSGVLEQDPRHGPARQALAEYYQRQPR